MQAQAAFLARRQTGGVVLLGLLRQRQWLAEFRSYIELFLLCLENRLSAHSHVEEAKRLRIA